MSNCISKSHLILMLVALAAPLLTAAPVPAIIPIPQHLTVSEGAFVLKPDTSVCADESSRATAESLAVQLRQATGYAIKVCAARVGGNCPGAILITTSDAKASLGAEGYELTVTPEAVVIRAPAQAGLFYGGQTLRQILPPQIFSAAPVQDVAWTVPCVTIEDAPRFVWRGLMLDVSRHFFTKSEVEQLLEVMAVHKINTFHWHLVDDNGWRIEIKKYPKLTSIGAWRGGVGFGLATNSTTAYGLDGRYGGFYTQEDIREVVAFAAARHITIVPEIEMPGHSLAALSAYPEYGTGNGPFIVPLKGGINLGIYSPAKEGAFEFIDDVLTEVAQLFPSKYIHIGGDEVPKGPWKADAACQALKQRENLKSEEELQSWFIRRIEKMVNAKGKTIIGWSEILQGGLAQNAAVMDWIGGGREAARQGHDVVMTPTSHCYFDFYQSKDHATEPRAIGGFLPLQKVYSFEPVPGNLEPEMQKHILGAQGNVWTEYIPNLNQVEYMAFPRLSALAEVTWSSKDARNFDDFIRRLKIDEQRLGLLGVTYRSSTLGDGQPAQIKTELK